MKQFFRNLWDGGGPVALSYALAPVHVVVFEINNIYVRAIYVFGVRVYQHSKLNSHD